MITILILKAIIVNFKYNPDCHSINMNIQLILIYGISTLYAFIIRADMFACCIITFNSDSFISEVVSKACGG